MEVRVVRLLVKPTVRWPCGGGCGAGGGGGGVGGPRGVELLTRVTSTPGVVRLPMR